MRFFQTNNWDRFHQPQNEFRMCPRGGPTRESEKKTCFLYMRSIGPYKAWNRCTGISSEGNEIRPDQKYLANLLAVGNMSIYSFAMRSLLVFAPAAKMHPLYEALTESQPPMFVACPWVPPGPDQHHEGWFYPGYMCIVTTLTSSFLMSIDIFFFVREIVVIDYI